LIRPAATYDDDERAERARMSSRRSSRGNISEDEINELISKLQALLPSSRRRGSGQVRRRR